MAAYSAAAAASSVVASPLISKLQTIFGSRSADQVFARLKTKRVTSSGVQVQGFVDDDYSGNDDNSPTQAVSYMKVMNTIDINLDIDIDTGLSNGAIAGIIIGCIIGTGLVVVLLFASGVFNGKAMVLGSIQGLGSGASNGRTMSTASNSNANKYDASAPVMVEMQSAVPVANPMVGDKV
jgi:hypothetical protein